MRRWSRVEEISKGANDAARTRGDVVITTEHPEAICNAALESFGWDRL